MNILCQIYEFGCVCLLFKTASISHFVLICTTLLTKCVIIGIMISSPRQSVEFYCIK